MKKDIKKEYSNGELTIVWQPAKCIHSAICVQSLPKVYDPKAKPWIKMDNATTQALIDQVDKCPSGALSYYLNGEEKITETTPETKIDVRENGPLLVYGALSVTDKNVTTETQNKATAFCRCGQSENKPYCDGTHVKVDFKG